MRSGAPVKTHFQTLSEDQGRKKFQKKRKKKSSLTCPASSIILAFTFKQQIRAIFSRCSDIAFMFAGEKKSVNSRTFAIGFPLFFFPFFFFSLSRWYPFLWLSESAPVKERAEWNSSCSVVLQKYVKIDRMH